MVEKLGGRVFLKDRAAVHEDDAARHLAGEAHLVRHDRHGHAVGGELAHEIKHLADHLGVERARRLVKEHHVRLHAQRADDRNALLLSAGEHVRILVCLIRKTDAFQKLHAALFRLVLRFELERDGGERDVLHHGLVGEEIEVLEHHAHFAAVEVDVHLFVGDVHAAKIDMAGGRRFQQVQAPEQRGFAAAGRADDRHDLAARYGERALVERCDAALEFLCYVLNADEFRSCRHGAFSFRSLRWPCRPGS